MTVLAAIAVFVGSVAQVVTGFGFGLVSAPFLVAAYHVPGGVQINATLAVLVNILLVAGGRRDVGWATAGRLLAPAVVATLVVGRIVRDASTGPVTVVAGGLCLVGVILVARDRGAEVRGERRPVGRAGTLAVGTLSGAMSVSAGIGGPPVVLFGVHEGWPPRMARATLQAYFLALNVVTLVALGLPDRLPPAVLAAMVLGLPVGRALTERVTDHQVRRAVLVIAAVGSVLAIARGLTA